MRQIPLKRNQVFSFMLWAACVLLCGVGARPVLGQLATSDHVELPGFWPTKPMATRSEYVGAKVCAECHESIAQSSGQTPMAHAAMLATESSVLQSASKLHFTAGAYQYSILPPPPQCVPPYSKRQQCGNLSRYGWQTDVAISPTLGLRVAPRWSVVFIQKAGRFDAV